MASIQETVLVLFAISSVVLAIHPMICMSIVFKVGDSVGWTDSGNLDYTRWAAARTFHLGDVILFEYDPQLHSVVEVSLADYRNCNTTSPMATYSSGNDSLTIISPGHYFYICGVPGHCQAGQKVDIRVPRSPLQ